MSEASNMIDRGGEFLAAAESELAAGRLETAFALARTAAELAGKALLFRKLGHYPEGRHDIGGAMAQAGVVPAGLDKGALASFLAQHTRGAYGFGDSVQKREAVRAVAMARRLAAAAKASGAS